METLIATRPILLQNRLYQPGEALPAWDKAAVAAWLEAGSAVLAGEERENAPAENSETTLTALLDQTKTATSNRRSGARK